MLFAMLFTSAILGKRVSIGYRHGNEKDNLRKIMNGEKSTNDILEIKIKNQKRDLNDIMEITCLTNLSTAMKNYAM